jgi:hypothetical protein
VREFRVSESKLLISGFEGRRHETPNFPRIDESEHQTASLPATTLTWITDDVGGVHKGCLWIAGLGDSHEMSRRVMLMFSVDGAGMTKARVIRERSAFTNPG